MELSIIVAAAENNVIGRDNGLIWHLSADLKRFKALTTGHTVLMGRKTFQSIGRALPNRRNVVISKNPDFVVEGVEVVAGISEAMELLEGEGKVFIIGGGSIYREFWNKVSRLYLTKVHTSPEGDTFIPNIDLDEWDLICQEGYEADEKNEYNYTFIDYQRKL
ncbi:MAG: dihydrofolate reductase [Odoribacter sp.]